MLSQEAAQGPERLPAPSLLGSDPTALLPILPSVCLSRSPLTPVAAMLPLPPTPPPHSDLHPPLPL